jgi:hypothetical protein
VYFHGIPYLVACDISLLPYFGNLSTVYCPGSLVAAFTAASGTDFLRKA